MSSMVDSEFTPQEDIVNNVNVGADDWDEILESRSRIGLGWKV